MYGSMDKGGRAHEGAGTRVGAADRKEKLLEKFAQVAKALANAKRLMLVDVLAQGERSVESLSRATGLGVTTTLRPAGTLTSRPSVTVR
jgi:DNA-binding transcriptional ArsR family regulator